MPHQPALVLLASVIVTPATEAQTRNSAINVVHTIIGTRGMAIS